LNEKFIANGGKQEGNSNYRGKIEKLAVKKFFSPSNVLADEKRIIIDWKILICHCA
jgi:hypothetical protein